MRFIQWEDAHVKRVKTVIRLHLAKLRVQARGKGIEAETAKQQLDALTKPAGTEKPLVGLLNCAADYADDYHRRIGKPLGSDGILSDAWADLIVAILSLSVPLYADTARGMEDYAREIVEAAGFPPSVVD